MERTQAYVSRSGTLALQPDILLHYVYDIELAFKLVGEIHLNAEAGGHFQRISVDAPSDNL